MGHIPTQYITSAAKAPTATKLSANRPNVILIMVDDMGYSDLGCYSSKISTPNLDWLANEGIRLREFYNNSIYNWKLVSTHPSYKWELSDLANDRGETKNLADSRTDLVNELSAEYFRWAEKNGVVDYNTIKPQNDALPGQTAAQAAN